MNYEIVSLQAKTVVGLPCRTKNSDPDMTNKIGTLWSDFYGKGVYSSIKNKANDKSICVYTDYALDVNGLYTAVVGCEVHTLTPTSPCTCVKKIPEGRYAKFVVCGPMHEAIGKFWNEFWTLNLSRSYTCDFEEYQNSDLENAIIHIYISIK